MKHIHKHLSKCAFSFTPKDTRVLSGSEEALYDWMAVSFAFQTTRAHSLLVAQSATDANEEMPINISPHADAFFADVFSNEGYLGSADMGGSSKQLSYTTALPAVHDTSEMCQPDWIVNLPGIG